MTHKYTVHTFAHTLTHTYTRTHMCVCVQTHADTLKSGRQEAATVKTHHGSVSAKES